MRDLKSHILLFVFFLFVTLLWLQLATGVNKIDESATVKVKGGKKKSSKKKKVNIDDNPQGDDSKKYAARKHILKIIIERMKDKDQISQDKTSDPYQDIKYSHIAHGSHGKQNMHLADILIENSQKGSEGDEKNKNLQLILHDFENMLNPNIT